MENKTKNLTLKTTMGGGYVRKHIYLNLLNKIEEKGISITDTSTIVSSTSKSFAVDKKYEKICNLLVKKLEGKLNKEQWLFRVKYIAAIWTIVITALLSKENIDKIYAEEIVLEDIDTSPIEIEEPINPLEKQEENYSVKQAVYIVPVEIQEENNVYDFYLREYSKYFHLNVNKVIELAKIHTNDYKNFENVIPEVYKITSPEAACMLFVYFLYRGDLNIEYNKEELKTTDAITTAPHDNLNLFYLSTGEKYSQYIEKICDLFQIEDKTLALSTSFTEISKNGSYSSNTRNNFGGMKYKGEHVTYPTPEAGIISFCGNFKKLYNGYNIDTVEEMACYYVTGKKQLPNPNENKVLYNEVISWKKSVESFYNEINENYDNYFTTNTEEMFVRKLSN